MKPCNLIGQNVVQIYVHVQLHAVHTQTCDTHVRICTVNVCMRMYKTHVHMQIQVGILAHVVTLCNSMIVMVCD